MSIDDVPLKYLKLTAKALEFVGDNSTYQKRIIYVFSIQWALFAFITMGLPLLLVKPLFLCQDGDRMYRCYEEEACDHKFIIDTDRSESSISLDFGLYCD